MKAVREISLLTTISGWALRKELRAWRLAKVHAPFESPAGVFCLRSLQSNIPFPGESSAKCQPIEGQRHPNGEPATRRLMACATWFKENASGRTTLHETARHGQ